MLPKDPLDSESDWVCQQTGTDTRGHFYHFCVQYISSCKSDGSNLLLDIKNGKIGEKLSKTVKTYKNLIFFQRIARFWERFARITSKSLMSLFFQSNKSDLSTIAHIKEQREPFAHGRSFLKSDENESLTVAL